MFGQHGAPVQAPQTIFLGSDLARGSLSLQRKSPLSQQS